MKRVATPLYQLINNAHEYETYQAIAPEKATYPYVTYKLMPVDNTEKDRDDYTLEISCWDKSESTSHARVMQVAESIRKALLNHRHLDDNILIIIGRPNVGYVPDPDALIKRYDVRAIIKTYRR